MTKVIKAAQFALLALILILAYSSLTTLKMAPRLPWLSLFSPKEEKIADTPVVVQEIRHIAQLATQSYYDECIYDSGFIRTGFLSADKRLILIARGEVIAGFDLNRMAAVSLDKKEKLITLELDSPRILDVIVNPSDYEIFIQDGDFSFDEVVELKERAKQMIAATAVRKHVLERSAEHGERIIEKFFRLLGFEKITIRIQNKLRLGRPSDG